MFKKFATSWVLFELKNSRGQFSCACSVDIKPINCSLFGCIGFQVFRRGIVRIIEAVFENADHAMGEC